MTQVRIDFDSDDFEAYLRRLTANETVMNSALTATAIHLKSILNTYPPTRRKKVSSQWSDKQRRGFFAKLNAGEIDVPYRRGSSGGSQAFGRSITHKVTGNTATVGTNVSYAKWLVGEKQAFYHKGNWTKWSDALDKNRGQIVSALDKAMKQKIG
jgi:hypothetical protein